MYKLIIADDDSRFLERFCRLVDWKAHGFEVAAMLFDGEDVIKYIEENHDEIIEAIAKIAKDKKIGARAISSIVNEMFSDIMFNLSDEEENYNELTISKDTVTDPKKYILRK